MGKGGEKDLLEGTKGSGTHRTVLLPGGDDQGKLPAAQPLCFGYSPLEPIVKIAENNLKLTSISPVPRGKIQTKTPVSKNTSPTLSKH